ncbi:hypothetical protein [Stenotrophomonas sp. AB1(2024)]|uniref:hypothetical protein n=1 Tax=Stenotrophomonas sp. AB1(2024) TaxID=3132215 RepID=UPI0030A6DBC9
MFCRRAVVTALLLAALTAQAGDVPRYLLLLNRSDNSITALQVAAAGTEAFESRQIDPVAGGGGSTTVRLGNAGCRFDLHLQFRNGSQAFYRDVDICRGDTLVVR